jgi:hypothetical protein
MTNAQPPAVRRDARGYWLPGTPSPNPSGKPARVKEIESLAQEHSPAAFAKIVSLLDHQDGKTALAAAVHILDRAFGKPAQAVQAQVQTLDISKLWVEAMKMGIKPPVAPAPLIIESSSSTPLSPPPADDGCDTTSEW